jgi:hypothetical protein
LQKALACDRSQQCVKALLRAAEAGARRSIDGHRPDRLTAPSDALPPLP